MTTIYGIAVQANDEGGDEILAATNSRPAAEKHVTANEGHYIVEIPFFDGELVTQTQHRVRCWANADGAHRPNGPKNGDYWNHTQYEVFVPEEGCSWELYPKSTWASCWGADGDACEARLRAYIATLGATP